MIRILSTTLCAALLLGSASLHADEVKVYPAAQQSYQQHLEYFRMVRHDNEWNRNRDYRNERREERWERWRDNDRRHWGHKKHWRHGHNWGHRKHWRDWRHDNYWRHDNRRWRDDYWRYRWDRYDRS